MLLPSALEVAMVVCSCHVHLVALSCSGISRFLVNSQSLLLLPHVQDHFRPYAKPTFTDVYRDRGEAIGVAEFETLDDMQYAIRKLDDTEFKNPFESGRMTITEVGSMPTQPSNSSHNSSARLVQGHRFVTTAVRAASQNASICNSHSLQECHPCHYSMQPRSRLWHQPIFEAAEQVLPPPHLMPQACQAASAHTAHSSSRHQPVHCCFVVGRCWQFVTQRGLTPTAT